MARKSVKKEKNRLSPIACKGCGTRFVPKTKGQRYHSDTCREEYYGRTYFHREVAELQCPNCGVTFSTTKPGRQVYCTPECRVEASQKRRDNLTIGVQSERHKFYGDRYKQLEADGFACRLCGKMARDGVKLDVESDGRGGQMTVCNQCKEGRKDGKSKTVTE